MKNLVNVFILFTVCGRTIEAVGINNQKASNKTLKLPEVNEYSVHLNSIRCSADNNTTSDLVCFLKARRSKIATMTFGITMLKPANQVWFQISLHYKYSSNRYGLILYHKPENFCAFYASGAKGNIVIGALFPFFKNFTIVHACPYLAERHELVDYEFDLGIIPPLMPSGYYRTDVRLSNELNETVFFTQTFAQVRNFKIFN